MANIHIILVETSHPGNIGGVARAMKNMALTQLRLVNPKTFPHAKATARASGADGILAKAKIYPTLDQAIADCALVIGASARSRTINWPEISPKTCAQRCLDLADDISVAIVFGREHSGLTNEELDLCQYLLKIPCNPDFSSLNIAAAVQVVCYELFIAHQHPEPITHQTNELLATSAQMESFYTHLLQTIKDIGFLQPEKSESMMRKLRRVFNRTQLEMNELDILRGILRFAQNHNQEK